MPYAHRPVIHDADSHVMEIRSLKEWMDPEVRDRLAQRRAESSSAAFDPADIDRRHDDPEHRRQLEENVMATKGPLALGAYRKEDRPRALDLLGFASQLVFTTAHLASLLTMEQGDDVELAYGYARAHNRAMVDFCSVDDRLLPACYLPLADIERSKTFATEAIEAGAAALMVASACPREHSHSHVGLDPVWAQAEEAGVPIVFHVGGTGPVMDPNYLKNGLPPVKDFTGGDGNFTSVSFMGIPSTPMQTLAVMIIDGVLDRFPNLKIGVIELGAAWVPGWMRSLDSAAEAFVKNEERLRNLSLKPSEFVVRQVRVTPYPHEPVGWIIANTDPSICMFSSDYPHTEGGRNPIKRFEASMAGTGEAEKQAFYCDNFVDLMGPALDRALRQRQPAAAS